MYWNHWIDAYEWDRAHPLKINHRLTQEHFFLDTRSKMRNHLATEILDDNMLALMRKYKGFSGRKDLEGTIILLEHTSKLVKLFSDLRIINSQFDSRLNVLEEFKTFLVKWKETCGDIKTNFITRECYEDLLSLVIGFPKLIKIKLEASPMGYICPGRTSTDIVENFFCNQRSINGCNNNPTLLQYQKGINSILISRKMVSKKSNAQCKRTISGAVPYKIHSGKSFKKLRL